MQSYSETRATVLKWNAIGVTTGVGADKAAGPVTFVLSTDEVDRHGDVVSADGWRLEAYRENPVLLWAHDYQHPAIGDSFSRSPIASPKASSTAGIASGGYEYMRSSYSGPMLRGSIGPMKGAGR